MENTVEQNPGDLDTWAAEAYSALVNCRGQLLQWEYQMRGYTYHDEIMDVLRECQRVIQVYQDKEGEPRDE